MITSGITAFRSTGATLAMPGVLVVFARAYGALGKFGDAGAALAKL